MKNYLLTLSMLVALINATEISAQSETIQLVKDIHINSDNEPHGLSAFGNNVLFIASDGIHGMEPWISDGTEAGTFMLKDIWPGNGNSYNSSTSYLDNYWNNYFFPLNGSMVFAANDSIRGLELWITDGTPEGTNILKEIKQGTQGTGQQYRILFNNKMYFNADDGTGQKIWVSDGTEAGTMQFADIKIGGQFSAILNEELYFCGDSVANGREFWVTNGTPEGTRMIKDINPGGSDSDPNYITAFGNKIIFSADSSGIGEEPWISDGTTDGTHLLKDINTEIGNWGIPSSSQGRYYYEFQDKCYFRARGSDLLGTELWVTDGTEDGTQLVININTDTLPANPDSSPSQFIEFNSELYFKAQYLGESTIWKIEEAGAQPTLFKAGGAGFFHILNDHLYFIDEDGVGKTDGTVAGTTIIPFSGSYIRTMNRCGNQLFLTGMSSTAIGSELYVIENTTGITNYEENEFSLYPNPAADVVNLNIKKSFNSQMLVTIADISGRVLIYSQLDASQSSIQLNTSTLAKGIYIIEVGGLSKKIIKI
ncbi:MAG: T9SS type A sorting domain-containing protein [Bacteroidia bacterium]